MARAPRGGRGGAALASAWRRGRAGPGRRPVVARAGRAGPRRRAAPSGGCSSASSKRRARPRPTIRSAVRWCDCCVGPANRRSSSRSTATRSSTSPAFSAACRESPSSTAGWISRRGRDSIDAFTSGGVDVLLATDAAAHGLNLQARCRLVVDLELPWNPVRLEQRVGRVDRIGQRRVVHAVRLVAGQTGEEAGARPPGGPRPARARGAGRRRRPRPPRFSEIELAESVFSGTDAAVLPAHPRGLPPGGARSRSGGDVAEPVCCTSGPVGGGARGGRAPRTHPSADSRAGGRGGSVRRPRSSARRPGVAGSACALRSPSDAASSQCFAPISWTVVARSSSSNS